MASIVKRGESWLVRIVRKGQKPVRKSFHTKRDAEAFAAVIESEMARGVYRRVEDETTSFRELLERYKVFISQGQRGAAKEAKRVATLLKPECAARAMLDKTVASLTAQDVARWRDRRAPEVAPATLVREWAIFGHVLEVARLEWGFGQLANPFKDVRKPKVINQRDRRVTSDELDAIVAATQSVELGAFIRLAIETGARRGELVTLAWNGIDLKRHIARLQTGTTKNGHGRTLPLSPAACSLLEGIPRRLDGGTVFSLRPDSVSQAFRRALLRARKAYEAKCIEQGCQPEAGYLQGIRPHDARHEACSRMAELGLSATELAAISGHRTLQLLARYVHHRPEQLAEKLARASARD